MIRNMRHNVFRFNVTRKEELSISSWAQTNTEEIPF